MCTNKKTFGKTHGTKSSLWLYFYEWAVNILKLYQIGSFPYSSKNKFELCNSFGIWISAQYWPLVLKYFCLAEPGIFCGRLSFPVTLTFPYKGLPLSFQPISLSLSVPPVLFLEHWSSYFCLLLRYLAHTTYFLIFSSFIPEHLINSHFLPLK